MAFWAIKRESQQITTGLKRTSEGVEAWGVNLTLEDLVVDVNVKVWDVRTGRELYDQVLLKDFALASNCSTEFPTFSIPEALESSGKSSVAAIYLNHKQSVLARHVNFHEPLKEVPFNLTNNLTSKICNSGKEAWLELTATVPVKGVFVEAQGNKADEVVWDDNGVDLVPGEIMRLPVKGLQPGDEKRLSIRWLGRELQ
jgi:beta-mannosidase